MIPYSAILPFARTRPSCTDSAVAGLAGGSSNGNSSRCHKGKENVGDAHFGKETGFGELVCRRESVRVGRLVLMVFSLMGFWGFIYLFQTAFWPAIGKRLHTTIVTRELPSKIEP